MRLFRRRKPDPTTYSPLSLADRVWNRAALDNGGPHPREGDVALADLLLLHGEAMNNGLLHAVTDALTEDELDRALAGYRYFGLDDLAALVASVRTDALHAGEDDPGLGDRLEEEADRRYAAVVPDDETLARAFEAHFERSPESFAPLGD